MCKKIVQLILVLLSLNTMAQNSKILGKWQSIAYTRIDTTDLDREEMDTDYEAYRRGFKQISPEYIHYSTYTPSDKDFLLIYLEIIQVNNNFYFKYDYNDDRTEIKYSTKDNSYFVEKEFNLAGLLYPRLYLDYDEVTQHLLLYDKERGIPICEFERR